MLKVFLDIRSDSGRILDFLDDFLDRLPIFCLCFLIAHDTDNIFIHEEDDTEVLAAVGDCRYYVCQRALIHEHVHFAHKVIVLLVRLVSKVLDGGVLESIPEQIIQIHLTGLGRIAGLCGVSTILLAYSVIIFRFGRELNVIVGLVSGQPVCSGSHFLLIVHFLAVVLFGEIQLIVRIQIRESGAVRFNVDLVRAAGIHFTCHCTASTIHISVGCDVILLTAKFVIDRRGQNVCLTGNLAAVQQYVAESIDIAAVKSIQIRNDV